MGLSHLFENQSETAAEGETTKIQNGNLPSWLRGTIFTTGPGKFHFQNPNHQKSQSRNGSHCENDAFVPKTASDFTVKHFTDGFAILCKFEIAGNLNQINFKKVFEKSDARAKADAAGKPALAEYFTKSSPDVTKNRFSRWISILPEMTDNGNHNIYAFNSKLYTTNGLPHFREIDPDDLSTGHKYDTNKLFGLTGLSPHPIIDDDGNFYNTGGAVSPTGAKQVIIKVPSKAKNGISRNSNFGACAKNYETLCVWPMSRAMHCTIHHGFTITQNYIILIEQPFSFNIKKLVSWVFSGAPTSLAEMTEWEPNLPLESSAGGGSTPGNYFIVVEKNSGKMVVKREIQTSAPFFFLHFVNSYEDRDEHGREILIVDLISHPNTEATMAAMDIENLKNPRCCGVEGDQGIVHRYTIPLPPFSDIEAPKTPKNPRNPGNSNFGAKFAPLNNAIIIVEPGAISSRGIKATVINPNYRFKKYQYFYGNSGWNFSGEKYGGKICKFDLKSASVKALDFGGNYFLGEMVFVPRPAHKEDIDAMEDDGILICTVYEGDEGREIKRGVDSNSNSNFLVFVCTKTMKELGRAYFKNELPIPSHAIYLPN